MQNGDEASRSIILAGLALLVKMLITLELCGSFGSKLSLLMYFNIVQPLVCKTVTRLHLASFVRSSSLMKMFITLEPFGLFGSNFAYKCILTLSSRWYAEWRRGFTKHDFGRLSCLSEKTNNS